MNFGSRFYSLNCTIALCTQTHTARLKLHGTGHIAPCINEKQKHKTKGNDNDNDNDSNQRLTNVVFAHSRPHSSDETTRWQQNCHRQATRKHPPPCSPQARRLSIRRTSLSWKTLKTAPRQCFSFPLLRFSLLWSSTSSHGVCGWCMQQPGGGLLGCMFGSILRSDLLSETQVGGCPLVKCLKNQIELRGPCRLCFRQL